MLLLLAADRGVLAQGASSFDKLRPQQQKLVRQWAAEYQKILRAPVDPEVAFNKLSLSARTTFDAITHSLSQTQLTDLLTGKPLGTALDLVAGIESVNGELSGARGDHQFRLYVRLKQDALKKLYASAEFVRTGDNTVYHIGFPVNFRLQGKEPSIQFSLTRTGRRADIDVDYRSSHGPQALVNGHLTAANSDVRAGKNYSTHVRRWDGLAQWWLSLFNQKSATSEEFANNLGRLEAMSSEKKTPAAADEAIHDFFETWLVKRDAMEAVKYISIRAFACIAEVEPGATVETPLIRVRFLQHMAETNLRVGEIRSLEPVLQAIPLQAPNSLPAENRYPQLFHMESLRDDAVAAMDCRNKFKVALAERLRSPEGKHQNQYAATMKLRYADGSEHFATLIWEKEEDAWKIHSWSLENPFAHGRASLPALAPASTQIDSKAAAPARLVSDTNAFMQSWLGHADFASAVRFFAPESAGCLKASLVDHSSRDLQEWLQWLQSETGAPGQLETKIERAPYGHEGLVGLTHPQSALYALARMSDDLGAMNACPEDVQKRQITKKLVVDKPKYLAGYHMQAFRFKSAVNHGATMTFVWAPRGNEWKIVSYYAIVD